MRSPSASRRHAQLELGPEGLQLRNVSRTGEIARPGLAPVPPGGLALLDVGAQFIVGGQLLEVEALSLSEQTLVCANATCRREVSSRLKDCPWCGTSLAFAITRGGVG
ncbi:MAG: hypothetical protein H6740_13270 [Alphaproteobacteria bacterium]|nr:hypothetical protein [Alphaproteobacteria bacterium]